METSTSTERDFADFTHIIADDHPSVTLAVGQMLADLLGVVASRFSTTHTSASLLDVCAQPSTSPRIVILDLVMPGRLKRAALVRALLAIDPKLRLLVYTADESAFLARAVIDAGALGYVAKTSPTSELVKALAAVANDQAYIDSHINLDGLSKHAWTSLTDSERAVLIAFCRGAKANEIVDSTGRSYSTVTTHKYNGLNKLGLRDGSDLLPYIYSNGLLHELDDEPRDA
jgi:DNA-binding NarL/FixJ family response regulator